MRVVSGTVGGRRLRVPSGVRPTSDVARGAIFNSLASMGMVDGAVVWDLFTGSGALGIEALSRGARHATFVDRDRRATAAVRVNVEMLGLADRASVVTSDVMRWVRPRRQVDDAVDVDPVDVVFADPPYAFDGWNELLGRLSAKLAVCESDQVIDAVGSWQVARVLRHGGTVVSLLQPRGVPTL